MYCCMSPRSRETYLPPGMAPLIPLGQRRYRTVRFSSDTDLVEEEKLWVQTGRILLVCMVTKVTNLGSQM